METLQAHRERVRRLREQFARMLQLRQAIYDAREESWDLRTHWEAAREARINELHARIDAMAEEVELIREAHFGATVAADRMGHAVSVPEHVLGDEAPPPKPITPATAPRPAAPRPAEPPGPASPAGLDGIMGDAARAAEDAGEPETFAQEGLDALMGGEEVDAPMADDDPGDLGGLAEADDSPDEA